MTIASPRKTSLLVLATLLVTVTTAVAEFKAGNKQLGITPGGKAAFIDYNNAGWIDLFAGQLWKNEGGKKFVLAKDSKAPGGEVIWGDFDNDGNVDVFQFTGAGSLHRNKGDGTFEAVPFPKLPTVYSRGAVWLDINNTVHRFHSSMSLEWYLIARFNNSFCIS